MTFIKKSEAPTITRGRKSYLKEPQEYFSIAKVPHLASQNIPYHSIYFGFPSMQIDRLQDFTPPIFMRLKI